MSCSFDDVTKSSWQMHNVRRTYVSKHNVNDVVLKCMYGMRNVRNVRMPQAIGDVISGISIGIGTAAADSIGYRAPAWYRSNPTQN